MSNFLRLQLPRASLRDTLIEFPTPKHYCPSAIHFKNKSEPWPWYTLVLYGKDFWDCRAGEAGSCKLGTSPPMGCEQDCWLAPYVGQVDGREVWGGCVYMPAVEKAAWNGLWVGRLVGVDSIGCPLSPNWKTLHPTPQAWEDYLVPLAAWMQQCSLLPELSRTI